jgi:hypothetical protein
VTVAGIDGYALKDLKDHIALAMDVAEAFKKKKSKPNFQAKCVKEVCISCFNPCVKSQNQIFIFALLYAMCILLLLYNINF